jgi:hypothetical protein
LEAGTSAPHIQSATDANHGWSHGSWVGAINLGAVLEYGRVSGVIRRAGGFGQRDGLNFGSAGVKVVVKATTIFQDEESKMNIDDTGDIEPMV